MGFAAVQRIAKGTNGASVSIGSGDGWATPTTGNLLVVTANSDALVSITGTWTAGPSVIDGNGTYIWYRISDGTESTITCTPSVSDTIAITACEYSGNAASPFDTSNTSTIAGSAGTTTTSVSVTTTAAADLIIAAACLHTIPAGTPTSPTWTNSFTNQLTANSGASGGAGVETITFYAELIAGAAGSYSTSASWTNSASDRQELVIAFKAAAVASSPVIEPLVVTQPTPAARVKPPTILRSTLQDPPVLTTKPPLVVTSPASKAVPNQAITSRSSLVDVVVPAGATPAPLIVTQLAKPTPPNQALLWRSSLFDLPGEQPLVVTSAARVYTSPPAILRGSLFDAPVLTTPAPLIITRPATPIPGFAAFWRSSLVDAPPDTSVSGHLGTSTTVGRMSPTSSSARQALGTTGAGQSTTTLAARQELTTTGGEA